LNFTIVIEKKSNPYQSASAILEVIETMQSGWHIYRGSVVVEQPFDKIVSEEIKEAQSIKFNVSTYGLG